MKLLPKRLKIKNIFPNLGSRITDKKFLLASFGSFSKTSVQSHRVSNSPEGRGKLDETREWKKFVRKIWRKISFRPNDPSLSTSRFLYFLPSKKRSLFIPWKEYSIMQQRINETSVYRASDFFEEICGQFELIFRGKCVVNRGSGLLHPRLLFSAGNCVLFTYLNGFVEGKENSPGRWVSPKIETNSDSWKKFRVILLYGVSSNIAVTVGWNTLNSLKVFQYSMSLKNNRIDDASNYVAIIENDYQIYKLYLLIYYTQIILTFLLSFFLKCSIQCYYS